MTVADDNFYFVGSVFYVSVWVFLLHGILVSNVGWVRVAWFYDIDDDDRWIDPRPPTEIHKPRQKFKK